MINLKKKDFVWNYLGLFFSFGINIFLLPLVLKFLSSQDLGLWYVFASIGALVNLIDFGFAPQMARSITYAYSGASEINKVGMSSSNNVKPNYLLLKKVISSAKLLYLLISIVALLLLIIIGTPYIYHINANKLTNENLLAWLIYCTACFINILYSYYNSIFRGLGIFVPINKAMVYSKLVQLVCSFSLLLLGYGLLAVSIAYLLSNLIFRLYLLVVSKKEKIFIDVEKNAKQLINFSERKKILKVIWYNSSKDGLVTISNFLVIQSNTIICSIYFGLNITASYALGVQLISFIASISVIIFSTLQPSLVNASLVNDMSKKRKIFTIGLGSYVVSFVLLVFCLILIGIPVLTLLKSNTSVNINITIFYAIYVFIYTNTNLSASYISTSNKLPYATPYIISSISGVLLAILFAEFTSFNIYGLISAHLLIQLLYNAWKWPIYVYKDLNTNPFKIFKEYFIFSKKELGRVFLKLKN